MYSVPSTVSFIAVNAYLGHDTTASTLSWCLFFLWKHPEILSDVRQELQSIFGDSSPEEIIVRNPETVLQKLILVTAVIKETLRVCPPASTSRGPKKDNPVMLQINGKTVPIYDMMYQTQFLSFSTGKIIL